MLAEKTAYREPDRRAEEAFVLADGRAVRLRPASLEDADMLRAMFDRLSGDTIYKRFHSPFPRVPSWAVGRLLEGDDGGVLVAVAGEEIVGHAMSVRTGIGEAEVAVLVQDAWQSAGLGKLLLAGLAEEAIARGVEVFTFEALGENRRVLQLTRAVFAEVAHTVEGGVYHVRARVGSLRAGLGPEKGRG